ncbi:hypothetical protein DCC85_09700 [Paenibacillus sp. CAA11]|uniref:DUF2188 domain-containing protein n=1 Tax=Paenibacillus sp. CAA11 TaxID=1532905 RepID=UPI000D355E8D|nr:DUF2188 domain-containing protein [Paenibacillus sp. CAA11]AWB44471.1 hypothetical protein DCC85_09700 [Paenibacillus sp. CAA11]
MPQNDVHTTPDHGGGWKVQQNGRKLEHYERKADAEAAGRKEARKDQTEHKIHNSDGKISESHSYGHDPFPPRG